MNFEDKIKNSIIFKRGEVGDFEGETVDIVMPPDED